MDSELVQVDRSMDSQLGKNHFHVCVLEMLMIKLLVLVQMHHNWMNETNHCQCNIDCRILKYVIGNNENAYICLTDWLT